MKKVLIASGVGFTRDESLERIAQEKGCTLSFFCPFSSPQEGLGNDYDIVLLSGLWSPCAEHSLYVHVLHGRMNTFLSTFLEADSKTKIFGMGRGAFILLEHLTHGGWREWSWRRKYLDLGPLAELDLEINDQSKKHLAKFSGWIASGFETHFKDAHSFCKYDGIPVGWRVNNAYLSLPDLFSVHGRSQQDGYGYEKTQNVSLGHELWEEILEC